MELMSRVNKHKVEKRKSFDMSWVLGLLLISCFVYPLNYFWEIPENIAYKQTLQISMFSLSVFFLSLYVLAFFIASTKTYVQSEEKPARINYTIFSFWVVSFLYHFIAWLTIYSSESPFLYYVGMAITLTAFILTLIHFLAYFSFMRRERLAHMSQQSLTCRQQAYESIQRILRARQVVIEAMNSNPEVKQMMKWNGFDRQMDRWIADIERFMHLNDFSDQDLLDILGAKAWMENLTMIIEQHPQHQGLRNKLN